MKLPLGQHFGYTMSTMVYRLGERVRIYTFRRMWRRYLGMALGVSLLAVTMLLLAGTMKITPRAISEALGIKKHDQSKDSAAVVRAANGKKPGSSKPAPKDTKTDKGAASVIATPSASQTAVAKDCHVFPTAHTGLANSVAPELRKLAQYEQVCGGAVATRTSFFIPMPSTVVQAQTSAQEIATKLKAYAQAGVAPLVFMEPSDLDGVNLDLVQLGAGAYDAALTVYYQTLQAAGITSATMGMWAYIPEGNLPVWSTTEPNSYAAAVTKLAQLQKQYFPGSQVSLMLDSTSYAPGAGWGSGSYTSLVPYVQSIPKGLIDSFGLQGFPWAAPANQPSQASLYAPTAYLRTDLAMQAARALGVNSIWFNTGTFNQMYAGIAGQTITNTPAQRQQMLQGVVQLAAQTKAVGFSVAIHLFAENKASVGEATDWSYWRSQPDSGAETGVFTTFARDANAAGVPLWLYDSL
jgi:hypothetical protein